MRSAPPAHVPVGADVPGANDLLNTTRHSVPMELPARTGNPEQLKVAEYGAFDVLRFALASGVMLSHMEVLRWSMAGNLAVQVFFALSGWLIGGILYNTQPRELGRFYFNRSTRVWIPYFATVTALYVISIVHEPVRSPRWLEFLVYDVTFTHNWFALYPDPARSLAQMPLQGTGNHFWSLCVEEQFYLIAPLIITLLPFGRKILPWCFIALAAYLTRSEYASISLGVLCAIAVGEHGNWHLGWWARVAFALCLVGAIIGLTIPAAYTLAAPAFSICTVLLCAMPVPRTAFARWLGGVSFPFYLNAWIGTFALHAILRHFAVHASLFTLALEYLAGLAAAAVSYEVLDKRVMQNRNRYYSPVLGWALGSIGYALVLTGLAFWLRL